MPFRIDSNGSISISKPLTNDKYEFDVVAVDCYPSSSNANVKLISEPARVTVKIIKSCKPRITGMSKENRVFSFEHEETYQSSQEITVSDNYSVRHLRN